MLGWQKWVISFWGRVKQGKLKCKNWKKKVAISQIKDMIFILLLLLFCTYNKYIIFFPCFNSLINFLQNSYLLAMTYTILFQDKGRSKNCFIVSLSLRMCFKTLMINLPLSFVSYFIGKKKGELRGDRERKGKAEVLKKDRKRTFLTS